ncbi:MAG: MFS transporter [Candidatus Nanopelagicaceae bacterium]|nr:MFS transporter [Candidatus Nanopelagicaceae bacterium]
MNSPLERAERRDLQAIFFLFGLGIMCLAPRLPDIKANLDVSTTYFGFLMSSGSIGALSAHLTMGHIVHRLGVYKVLIYSSTATYITLGILIELHNPEIYMIVNILCGFAWASYHIAINAQALHRQSESGTQIIPMLHGLWSAGAVTTAFIALLISSFVSLNWHIYPLIIIVYILKLRSIGRLRPILLSGNEVTEADEVVTFRKMISTFSIDWVVSLGFLCALMLEVSVGDWATIMARQEFEVSKSLAVVPYFLFMSAMIIGRLSYNRIKGDRSDKEMVQPFVVLGGTVFLVSLGLSLQLKETNLYLGFAVFSLGFLLTGFGISFVGPLFFGYASARSDKPGGVAVAELGALNQVLTFIGRGVISVVAGATTLPIAMTIPGVMLLFVAFFVAAASQPRKK